MLRERGQETLALTLGKPPFTPQMQSASDVLLFPLAGWLLDRLGRRAVGAASPAAIGLALLALSTAATQAQLVACVLLLGCGNGLAK